MQANDNFTADHLMSMWQRDLARHLMAIFFGPATEHTEHDLYVAGEVWRKRFGHFPTIGEVTLLAGD